MCRVLLILGGFAVVGLLVSSGQPLPIAMGITLGIVMWYAGLFVRFNQPHCRVIIRDPVGHIAGLPDGRLFLAVPFYHRLTERFDLSWRFTKVEERAFATLEGLPAHLTVRIGFIVDPANMDDQYRQEIIDSMGPGAERWALRVQEEAHAGLNLLIQQLTYPELASAEGHQALQTQLYSWLQQQVAGLGVTIVQVLVVQVTPSVEIMEIRADMLRRRALTDYIQTQLVQTLPALTPYTDKPIEALLTIGLLDRLSNRNLNGLALNVLSGAWAGNGLTQPVTPNAPVAFPMLAGH